MQKKNTMSEIIVHHKISDLYNTLGLPFEQEIHFSIMSIPDIHPQIPFKSAKLRADYFSFILTKEGYGTYYLDGNKFPYNSRTFYFTNPGHLKSYELGEAKEALIITLTEQFLREYVNFEIFIEYPFLLAEIVPPKKLPEHEFEEFEILYKQIVKEFAKNSVYKNKILGSLFAVLLLKVKECFWSEYDPIEDGNRDSQIVKSFECVTIRGLCCQNLVRKIEYRDYFLNSVQFLNLKYNNNIFFSEIPFLIPNVCKQRVISTFFRDKKRCLFNFSPILFVK